MSRHKLPKEVRLLVHARNELRRRYEGSGLSFTPDGNLVGDLGEAIAAELFDLQLVARRGEKAIDAYAPDGRTVQIKASGRGHAFVFTHSAKPAEWMIGLLLHYEDETVEVIYNGPYAKAISEFPTTWVGQRAKALSKFRRWDAEVPQGHRISLAAR